MIDEITERVAEQRDAIDDMVDYLNEVTHINTVDRVDDAVSAANGQAN